jgi:NADPH:quinone reductase-like Zn-dependent oxidoreductase
MKAAAYTEYGPPDVVQIMDVEKPVPKDNEVLIKVRAASGPMSGCLAQRRAVRRSGDGALREVREMVLRCACRGRGVAPVCPGAWR